MNQKFADFLKGSWVTILVLALVSGGLIWLAVDFFDAHRPGIMKYVHGTGFFGRVREQLSKWDGGGVINVALAGVVGALGALAYYYGVLTGFIGRENRNETLQYLSGSFWNKLHYVIVFVIMGGVVAAVFQAAQYSTFAPIQALVLGATWPSVVIRVMSGGDGGALTTARGMVDKPPASIPSPSSSKTAADAEVII